jgi:UDP-N-acetyl-D-mannosaminuronate dehydrogenase
MPGFTIERIIDALNDRRMSVKGSRILGLGVAYKRDSNDVRESPALEVIRGLRHKGAAIYYSDPYVPSLDLAGETIKSLHLTAEVIASMDCAVLLTDHTEFDYPLIAGHSSLILDSRNAFRQFSGPNIIRL